MPRFFKFDSTHLTFIAVVTFSLIGVCPTKANDPDKPVNGEPWRIGMSAAFSGPASALGNGMRLGIETYFDYVNNRGGVHGRALELIALDDSYEPSKTAPNMRTLIDQHDVMCVIGNVGTPTAAVAVPIANEKKIPMFGAFTGAGLLRKSPPDRYVINYRASYAEETAKMIQGVVKELGISPSEVGFFTQNDAYGDAGWKGAVKALKEIGFEDAEYLPHGRYTRNTVDIEDGLSRLMDPRESVKAVIMVGAYKPCAKFIKTARQHFFNPVFLNVSFVGSSSLVAELGDQGDGVIITQVVPTPTSNTDAAIEFRRIVPAESQNFVSLEGFLVAKAFVEGLQLAGPDASAESFIDGIESGKPIDLGLGFKHQLSKDEHQFSHQIWPTSIRDGQLILLEDWNQAIVDADQYTVEETYQ
ncbi:ABC transporter substrate-binding protein [Stieleria sp. JC731]|nr:ABC transporter substrate-binding protein [Stieleria sp. JC731]MCC9599307.1 ABC transporter substrate-binding protein [Stieleria sp. JC731]